MMMSTAHADGQHNGHAQNVHRRIPPLQQQQQYQQHAGAASLGIASQSSATQFSHNHHQHLQPGSAAGAGPLSSQNTMMSMAGGQQKQQYVVHEAFSIAQLERKFMFLNEPQLQQAPPNQAIDQIRQLWRVHHQQMLNMRPAVPEGSAELATVEAKRPDTVDEVCGQLSFSAASQRPKDFNLFQASIRNQLGELNRAHLDLRERFKDAGIEMEKDITRVENLTEQIQQAFNDCINHFSIFEQREDGLKTLHSQAIAKSKELGQKIQLEVLASSGQRSQLLMIVDDLTEQLKQVKASTVKSEVLDAEKHAHAQTRQLIQQKDRQFSELENEMKALNASLQNLGSQSVAQKADSQQMGQQLRRLEGIIDGQSNEIEDLLVRRSQLEQEVSRLKSLVELTQSSKDKIILKLKQEMRMQQHQNATINGTLTNQSTYAINNLTAGLNASPRLDTQFNQSQQFRQQQ